MAAIKNIALGILYGLWDSIRGMTLVLHIDNEVARQNAELETMRQLRRMDREQYRERTQRTPSPVPSSAAAMIREEYAKRAEAHSDERTLEKILKKKPAEKAEPQAEKKIAKKLFKCCILNGGFTWLSIVLFESVLLPTLKFCLTIFYGTQSDTLPFVWSWLHPILSLLFGMMWVLPIFMLSKIVSSLWFADIANAAYRVRKGRPQLIPSISKLVADFLFSMVVQMLFLVQSMLVNLVPVKYVGSTLCFVHLCLLYSLYSFEYKWFNMGWELHRRLTYIEKNWPYFFGFGIPLTVLTNMSSSVIVSSCIFSIFFPLFILSGNEAKPIVDTTEFSLRLFSPVVFISNMCFGGNPWSKANRLLAQQRKQLELQHRQRMLQREETLLKQKQQQYLMQQQREHDLHHRREPHSRSQTPQNAAPGQGAYRYAQPPVFDASRVRDSSASSTHSSNAATPSTNYRAPPYFGGAAAAGMRSNTPLVPTPVPGAPRAPIVVREESGPDDWNL
ncbi:etoposide-induced protein 2.4 homolog [Drosophila sulfurigaster albostrigata]|uniref:etoposide-induced protein 2.4 homolog n=1 Tax=Drosophila sulfurigaster albostrigata TaxID=89887 RepID=UPI002D21D437|nr:etoposide-induced protein 2.4 homolog [Drosophila sulfurigaster albostrigata]XP_062128991.1 etoposide-induced protein 2.4 homolog [Drosophila sulfurigaster albostrigata]XP_062129001.1 etoposide-induced protein 2.4 homolog [Drosophila sulfurigaster albostrigata]